MAASGVPPRAPAAAAERPAPAAADAAERIAFPMDLDLGRMLLPHRVENVPPPPDFVMRPLPSSRRGDARPCERVGSGLASRQVSRRLGVDIAPCLAIGGEPSRAAALPPAQQWSANQPLVGSQEEAAARSWPGRNKVAFFHPSLRATLVFGVAPPLAAEGEAFAGESSSEAAGNVGQTPRPQRVDQRGAMRREPRRGPVQSCQVAPRPRKTRDARRVTAPCPMPDGNEVSRAISELEAAFARQPAEEIRAEAAG